MFYSCSFSFESNILKIFDEQEQMFDTMFDFTCLIGARIDLEVPFHTKIMVLCERDIRDILVHF